MDWERAKKTFIYLLLLLNIGLFGFNYVSSQRYKVSSADEAAVYKVLSNNSIGIYCDIIKTYKPMKAVSVSASDYDMEIFKDMFFDSEEQVTTTLEFEKIILQSDSKTVETEENNVTFSCPKGTGEIDNFGKSTAQVVAESFAEKMNAGENIKSGIEKVYQDGESFVFEFDETFSGYKIFSNSKKIIVDKSGVIYAQASYYTVDSFIGEKQEICSCDEALLTVMYDIKNLNSDGMKYIEDIEIGYDFPNSTDTYDTVIVRLVPCYRVYISGMEEPYTINAYTNEIIKG